jgi:hypothetical protein
MDKNLEMGLKPLEHLLSQNPFTKVNGNKTNSSSVLLPSALADGLDKLLWNWALATFIIISLKCLIQLFKINQMFFHYCINFAYE